jgi:hypothetical protein
LPLKRRTQMRPPSAAAGGSAAPPPWVVIESCPVPAGSVGGGRVGGVQGGAYGLVGQQELGKLTVVCSCSGGSWFRRTGCGGSRTPCRTRQIRRESSRW